MGQQVRGPRGQEVEVMGGNTCYQTQEPEFESWDLYGRREKASTSYALITYNMILIDLHTKSIINLIKTNGNHAVAETL